MDQFYSLQIREIQRDTDQSVVLDFNVPPDLSSTFAFIQGQYLTLRATPDERELRRCYSICSGAHEGSLRIAIKEVPGGAFSGHANRVLKAGDMIDVMPPAGRFHTQLDPAAARAYAGFAAGSGITPILSHIRTILEIEPLSTFALCYVNRTRASTMFRCELDELRARHHRRLRVFHFLTREERECSFRGRLDAAQCRRVFESMIEARSMHAMFVCGPEEMQRACREAALAAGLDPARIYCELFVVSNRESPPRSDDADGKEVEVHVVIEGKMTVIHAAPDGPSILDVALDAGVDVPHSCCMGVCDTCRALVREGRVNMDANHVLSDDEVRNGYVLTCQSHPVSSERIILDFDHGTA